MNIIFDPFLFKKIKKYIFKDSNTKFNHTENIKNLFFITE